MRRKVERARIGLELGPEATIVSMPVPSAPARRMAASASAATSRSVTPAAMAFTAGRHTRPPQGRFGLGSPLSFRHSRSDGVYGGLKSRLGDLVGVLDDLDLGRGFL